MLEWMTEAINRVAELFPAGTWMNFPPNVRAMLVIAIVSVLCGAVGSLVVGNRMAFFSDALAHCAFAGITLGLITALAVGADEKSLLIPLVMVAFGVLVGLAIVFIRERTGLANDTVIGVFFAFAVGFGGMLFGGLQSRTSLNPESFMFGSPLFVHEQDILALVILGIVLAVVLVRRYNHFVLASFNPNLARSRQVPIRWCGYLFIVVLALIVNLSIRTVGVLLINAMLVVPAATAANFGRNLRQMFWSSILFGLAAGIGGLWISNTVTLRVGSSDLEFGPAGTVVVLSVLLFFASVVWKSIADRAPKATASLAAATAGPDNADNGREPGPPSPA